MSAISSISLISGPTPLIVIGLAYVTLALSFAWRRAAWKKQVLIGIPAAAAATGLVVLAVHLFNLIPYSFPATFYVWVGVIFLAIAVLITGWRHMRNWKRGVAGLSVILTALSAFVLVNDHYQYYPSIGAVMGVTGEHSASEKAIEQMRDDDHGVDPKNGFTTLALIPGTKSGFKARHAYVWLPPVWFTNPKIKLPVVEMLVGAPGSPGNWIVSSAADATANAFAAAHHGIAPILVIPDPNGAGATADTECVNSPRGQAETYLTVDVPKFVEDTYGSATNRKSWSIVGLSAGGMCATMLALRHPNQYSAFGDYSGLSAPTVGEVVEPAETTRVLFGGSTAEYQAHDPAHLLRTNKYPQLAGWFEVGTDDSGPYAAQKLLAPLAQQAGIKTCAAYIPGGQHSFGFWKQSFIDSLPWLSAQMGLTPAPASTGPATCS
jgi:S-formylglutathione hydrolase FrmB